jgi:secreted trypsin-like serine protease
VSVAFTTVILAGAFPGAGQSKFIEVDVTKWKSAAAGALCFFSLLAVATAHARPPHVTRAAPAVTPQIIGGVPAAAGTFGMMAFIIDDVGGDQVEFCTGTVLSSNVVLTAGHCGENTSTGIVDDPSGFTVVTGDVNWSDGPGRQVSGVSRVIVNPGFDPTTLDDDASLLVLSTPTTAPPVALATWPADMPAFSAGNSVTTAGWGETSVGSGPSQQLLDTGTVVQSQSDCAAHAAQLGASFDPTSQLCVTDAPTYAAGTCHGDSGGPVFAGQAGASVELGIVSSGAADCDTTQPDFLTRADAIVQWAHGWISAVKPATKPVSTVTSPTSAPPTTTSPVAGPEAGTYHGMTSQGLPITVRVASGRRALSLATFTFRLRCTGGVSRRSSFTPLRGGRWILTAASGLGFAKALRDRSGERYRFGGRFTASGSATGTLTTSWHNHRLGACSSGPVRWTAQLKP